jgi:hypothetical protein
LEEGKAGRGAPSGRVRMLKRVQTSLECEWLNESTLHPSAKLTISRFPDSTFPVSELAGLQTYEGLQ